MRRRTTNGLVAVAALVGLAAVGGNAARGTDQVAPSGAGATASATYTPGFADPSGPVPSEDPGAQQQAADAKGAADRTAAATDAADKAAAATAAAAKAAAAQAQAATWEVTKVVDGDTIWAARGAERVKVRLIGIDTPEVGQCGFAEASRNLRAIIGGQRVTLTPGAQTDLDRYGRLLRYVDVNGVDAGLRQIKQGYAVARYDSRDGYGAHARETAYVRADAASPKAACADARAGATSGSSGASSAGLTTSSGITGAWPAPGDRYPCPQARPVKGNESSMIAHEPGDRYYDVTKPEQCFATMSDAEAAGFRPAKV